MWKCRDGKFREVIFDGKIIVDIPAAQPQTTQLGATVAELPEPQDAFRRIG